MRLYVRVRWPIISLAFFVAASIAVIRAPCSAAAFVAAQSETNSRPATVTAGSSSLSYDATLDQYTYVWKTDKAWFGTCRQLTVRLNDATVRFCDRFIDRKSRTHDQMVQAARSGRQNIAEGSRASAAMAFDVARARLVMFGGARLLDESYCGDTWEWDGTAWVEKTAATSPSARDGHAMAYDSGRARTVLFGGNAFGYVNDTWEWDGSNWVQRTSASNPAARAWAS